MFLEEFLEEDNFHYIVYNRSNTSSIGLIQNNKNSSFNLDNDYQDYFNFITKNPSISESKYDFYIKGVVINICYKDFDFLYLKNLTKEFLQPPKQLLNFISRQEVNKIY